MDTTECEAVRSILHLIYHRNKNQHQGMKWWRWLSKLKRTVSDLVSMKPKDFINSSYPQYLSQYLIPRCYQAFSTVVADNQFSTLGIVLLATLARLVKATGIKFSKLARVEVKLPKNIPVRSEVDRGERIVRVDDVDVGVGVDAVSVSRQKQSSETVSQEKSSKEKTKRVKTAKKKKNAIDDIFGGLF
ncbi:uncharacterized protein N7469_005904 [Penicillium citrinum]|uniref:RNase MRP protein 1 RNA binding domain-containing protein n=1 Tax=Penicillium citrinum TaxID=5077 RepID=A0A9W9NWY9_PENCI|nr:uncharacterized protein N7469_005904 [Penicillium citrinum]KAJ5231316.1 hypothetical protein N7469_005904 [Penicillium citrinum]